MSTVQTRARIVRPSSGGTVTIPEDLRRELGIEENTPLRLSLHDGELRLKPISEEEVPKGSPWLRELYDYFAPVRQEILELGLTLEEVNADIDQAIREVRERRGRS